MVSGRPNLVYSPGPGLSPGTWDLGPSGPDLGPDLDLSLTIVKIDRIPNTEYIRFLEMLEYQIISNIFCY